MTKYQQEFYKFVIAPKNFEAICDIVENFEGVQEKLIYDFWVDVKSKCEDLLKGNKGWKVYLSELSDLEDTELTVYRDEFYPNTMKDLWEFAITVGASSTQGIYGLWLYQTPNTFIKERLLKIAKENKIAGWKYGSNFPFYKVFPEDFSELSSLKKIHPDNRYSLVLLYANEIVDAIKDLEPFINKHILKKK